jgi:hypothetical protein
MASDYTIIMGVRHRFGDAKDDAGEQDEDFLAPFVGAAGEFPFSCPNIDTSQRAILQFEYRGSEQFLTFPDPHGNPENLVGITDEHPVKVNGQLIAGGVPAAPQRGQMQIWSTRVLLIDPGVLKHENILRIETGDISTSNLDNFTVDNAVVFFKTGTTHAPPAEA